MACTEYVVLELNDLGNSCTYLELKRAICNFFGDSVEYFIPIYYEKLGAYESTSILFQGYVFIKHCTLVVDKLSDLREARVFLGPLRTGNRISTVDSRTIGAMKRRLKYSVKKRFKAGAVVKITEGIFSDLIGEVLGTEDEGRSFSVKIRRPTREIIAPIPCTGLIETDKSDLIEDFLGCE